MQEAREERDADQLKEARRFITAMKTKQAEIQRRLLRDDLLELAVKLAGGEKQLHLAYSEGTLGWELYQFFLRREEICLVVGSWCVITDKAVYRHLGSEKSGGTHTLSELSHVYLSLGRIEQLVRPLYTFNKPLTASSADFLAYEGAYEALLSQEHFEALVRTIPGSYKNGTWKQLSGFGGTYINHETRQVSCCPPALE